jgi:hypothetical protein
LDKAQPSIPQQALLDQVEPVLSYAQARSSDKALEATRRFVRLYGTPAYAAFDPDQFLQQRWDDVAGPRCHPFMETASECVADPKNVVTCLAALLRCAELDGDSSLAVELFDLDERGERIPCIAVGLDGPGRFPDQVNLDGFFPLSMDAFGERWTLATRGGRIDRAPNGWLLRLKGMRLPPDPLPEADHLLTLLASSAGANLTPAFEYVDGPPRESPGDLAALVREVCESYGVSPGNAAIAVQYALPPDLPPIVMKRNRLRAMLVTLLRYAKTVLPPEAGLTLHIEYDATARQVRLAARVTGTTGEAPELFHLAGLQRAAADHGGRLQFLPQYPGDIVQVTLPDPAGKALDEWLPGWNAFSEKSQQVLRLLKSGAPLPSPDLFLQCVLEEELDRYFWPRLNQPALVNVVHDLRPEPPACPGFSPERLKKTLTQLKRGKPKHELCQPQYLGDLLQALRSSERATAALGLTPFSRQDLVDFCRALLRQPPDYVIALRFLAGLREVGE